MFYWRTKNLNQFINYTQHIRIQHINIKQSYNITGILLDKGTIGYIRSFNQTFRERQHPRPAEIRKCEHKLIVAISYSDPLSGKLHHTFQFQAVMWFPQLQVPGPSLSWKISKFRGMPNNWPNMAVFKAIYFIMLCIIAANFRPIAKIFNELKWKFILGTDLGLQVLTSPLYIYFNCALFSHTSNAQL